MRKKIIIGLLALGLLTLNEESKPIRIERPQKDSKPRLEEIVQVKPDLAIEEQELTNEPYRAYLDNKSPFSTIVYESYIEKRVQDLNPNKHLRRNKFQNNPHVPDPYVMKIKRNVQTLLFVQHGDLPRYADTIELTFQGEKMEMEIDKDPKNVYSKKFFFYDRGLKIESNEIILDLIFKKNGENVDGPYKIRQKIRRPRVY